MREKAAVTPLQRRTCPGTVYGTETLVRVDSVTAHFSISTRTAGAFVDIYNINIVFIIIMEEHFTFLTDMFNQTSSQILWKTSNHMLQLMHEGCAYTYPPLYIGRNSFIQRSELEQCRVKKLAQCFKHEEYITVPMTHSIICEIRLLILSYI